MSDYTKTTDFGPKDVLASGDPNKKVRGTELDTEFDAIETAISTKYDSNDLGVVLQAYDADLAAIAALTSAADKVPYSTGAGTWALSSFTSFGRSLVDDADAAAAKTTLGLVIGTNVQAWDASLDSLSALATAGDKMPYTTAANTYAETSLTSFARTLLDDADAAAARTTLGVTTGPTKVLTTGGTTHTSTTVSNITGLSTSITSGVKYHVRVIGMYDCDVAGVGLKLGLTATAMNQFCLGVQIFGAAAEGFGGAWQGVITASGGTVTSTGLLAVDTMYTFIMEGIMYPSASGTLQIQAGVETTAGTPTVTMGNCLLTIEQIS